MFGSVTRLGQLAFDGSIVEHDNMNVIIMVLHRHAPIVVSI
jgi:hypothetical protein